jgi:Ser/Thr protein kinase RdoA (MazF antagonist)
MRKPDVDLRALDDLLVRIFGRRDGFSCQRTPTGTSTQVYRVDRDGEAFFVRIAEDAEASLAPEVELHSALRASGVRVPAVTHYEPFDDALARSVMVTTEVTGGPFNAATPEDGVPMIGRSAGRDLARIHDIPVQGFGWIRREHHEAGWPLRAENPTYAEYVNPAAVTGPLMGIGFTSAQAQQVEGLLEEAVKVGPAGGIGPVAHGDFDTSHIFESSGVYTGLIDFGEIRGTDYTFDFATLHLSADDRPPAPPIHQYVENGYAEIRPLPDDHQHRVYLACVLSASHRLARWFERDGNLAADGWFFRWIRDRLTVLLETGQVPNCWT